MIGVMKFQDNQGKASTKKEGKRKRKRASKQGKVYQVSIVGE